MGYKCATCGQDFMSLREQVEHMIVAHHSPFLTGDERAVKLSIKIAKEKNDEKSLKLLRDEELIVEEA